MSIQTGKTPLITFFVILLSVFTLSCSKFGDSHKPEPGYFAPDFTLASLDGEEYTLSDLKGKVVFVNFWATWCPPCKEELPSMARLYDKLNEEGLVILAVSVDTDEAALKKFVSEHKLPFPILRDTTKEVYKLYRATGVPETHLIDKSGIIYFSKIGPFNWMDRENLSYVKKLLSE